VDALFQDLRGAWRSLRRAPLFSFTVLLILSLGTGVAAGMLGIVYHLLLRPFAVPGHERVALLTDLVVSRGEGRWALTVPRLLAFRDGAASLERVEGYRQDEAVLEGRDGAEGLVAARGTPGLFRALGVEASEGRLFTDADGEPGSAAVAVVSERFARSHAGAGEAGESAAGAPAGGSLVGRMLRVDGVPTLVIGVLPAAAELPVGTDLWRPLALEAGAPRDERAVFGVARLRDGASLAAARAELASVAREQARQFPDTDADLAPELRPIAQGIQDPISPVFERIVSAAAILALAVVAANLAGLQLARGAARRREWAVRAAIGGSPARLARQSMAESLLLAAAGGVLAWIVARLTVTAVLQSVPPTVTRYIPGWSGIGVDGTLLALVFGLSAATGLAFGWVPALHAGRSSAQTALRAGGPGSLGGGQARARTAFVVAEVALSLVLLIGGVLMVDGFRRLGGRDLGFEPSGVLTLQVSLRAPEYPDAGSRAAFHERLLERVSALPGVLSAGLISRLPSSGSTFMWPVVPEGDRFTADRPLRASPRFVTPHTFDVLRLPVVQGRAIAAGDAAGAPAVAVVSETFARHAWPGRDPVGRRLSVSGDDGARDVTVVGVARDVKRNWYEREFADMVYLADAQWGAATTSLVVRADAPHTLATPVRRTLAALDPRVPARRVATLERFLEESTSGVRLGATLMGWLGVFALLLAATGLHALVAYQVAQRGPEFGVRMALGAGRGDILLLVLREGWRLALAGVAWGAPFAAAVAIVMTSTLFGIVRPGVAAVGGVLLALAAVTALALAAPAWRASRQDPMRALRCD
jgi:putative ABC transport system permease protein